MKIFRLTRVLVPTACSAAAGCGGDQFAGNVGISTAGQLTGTITESGQVNQQVAST